MRNHFTNRRTEVCGPTKKVFSLGLPNPNRRDQIEERIDLLVLPILQLLVQDWVVKRPLLAWSDSDPSKVSELLVAEVIEFIEEVLKHNGEALRSGSLEMADIYFFVFAFIFGNRLELDFSQIKNAIDGQGASSKSLESLLQICGDLKDYPNVGTASEILILLSSVAVNLGTFLDPRQVMGQKIAINTDNYPTEPLLPFRNGKPIPREMWSLAFNHAVKALRLIRRANKLKGRTKDTRLIEGDYLLYRNFILNFENSSAVIGRLGLKLSIDYNLDYGELMQQVQASQTQTIYNSHQKGSGVIVVERPNQVQRV